MTTSLLPPYTTPLERALEGATTRISDVTRPLDTIWDPEKCPASFLPWLAWQLSVDEWDPAWPEDVQRRVVASSLLVHRFKGTPGAVRLTLEALGLESVRIREWFDETPKTRPYTFRVDATVGAIGIPRDVWSAAFRAVNTAKNLRSHLMGMAVDSRVTGHCPIVASFGLSGMSSRILPALPSRIETRDRLVTAAYSQAGLTLTLHPAPIRSLQVAQRRTVASALHTILVSTVHPETIQ